MRVALALAAVLLVSAGCGASNQHWIAASSGPGLVLQPAAVPGLTQFADRPQAAYELHGTATRYGRLGGWVARYHLAPESPQKGVLVVESRVDLFPNGKDAERDFGAQAAALGDGLKGVAHHQISVARIGDETAGLTIIQQALKKVRFYTVLWRTRNATASVTGEGYDGQITLGSVLRLARRQNARLAAAA